MRRVVVLEARLGTRGGNGIREGQDMRRVVVLEARLGTRRGWERKLE